MIGTNGSICESVFALLHQGKKWVWSYKCCNFWYKLSDKESAFETVYFDEVLAVICCRIVREVLIWTALVLSRLAAHLITSHLLIPKDFKRRMVVFKRFRRNVRNYISVVNHSKYGIHFWCDVLSHSTVTEPWAAIIMNLSLQAKFSLESETCDFRQSASQTMSSGK